MFSRLKRSRNITPRDFFEEVQTEYDNLSVKDRSGLQEFLNLFATGEGAFLTPQRQGFVRRCLTTLGVNEVSIVVDTVTVVFETHDYLPEVLAGQDLIQFFEVLWHELVDKIYHLKLQLDRDADTVDHRKLRIFSPLRCVTVHDFRNFVTAYNYKLRGITSTIPEKTDFVTFIGHKWAGADTPFSNEDADALCDELKYHHPTELVWVDFLADQFEPDWKSALELGDYPRWILSCHLKIIVPGNWAAFKTSPWCIAEYLMLEHRKIVSAGRDKAEFTPFMEDGARPGSLNRLVDQRGRWDKAQTNEFLQCILIASMRDNPTRARLARTLLAQHAAAIVGSETQFFF